MTTQDEPAVSIPNHADAVAYAEREIDTLIDQYLRAIEVWLWLDRDEASLDHPDSSLQWISIPHAMALERDAMMAWRDRTVATVGERFTELFTILDNPR